MVCCIRLLLNGRRYIRLHSIEARVRRLNNKFHGARTTALNDDDHKRSRRRRRSVVHSVCRLNFAFIRTYVASRQIFLALHSIGTLNDGFVEKLYSQVKER